MQIDKQQIIDFLKSRGEDQKADLADQEMPEQVDTEQDQGMLEKFGINPEDLKGSLGDVGKKFGL